MDESKASYLSVKILMPVESDKSHVYIVKFRAKATIIIQDTLFKNLYK